MTFTVYGSNFTTSSVVMLDGATVDTFFVSSSELSAIPMPSQVAVLGTYSVLVSDPTGQSNTFSLTVYSPSQGPQPFLALPGYRIGNQESPGIIAMADVNGDGLDDVITNGPVSPGSPSIAVLFGQRDGTLSAPSYILGAAATTLAIGDVNGDGVTDIVAGIFPALGSNSSTMSSFTVLLNDGTGHFSVGNPQTFTGTYPGPTALVDIFGTGRKDLLIASHNPDVLYLFTNQGNGTFGPPSVLASLGPDRSFVVADFDGDGRPDIAISGLDQSGNENTHVLINNGGGTFTDNVPTALANVGGTLTAGDFNLDGRTDLAVEGTVQTSIVLKTFLNLGSNSFSQVSNITLAPAGSNLYDFSVGDFDHDGFPDLAGTNGGGQGGGAASMLFLWGDGTGNFASSQQVIAADGFFSASGDVNGDGIPDIVTPDGMLAATVVLGSTGRSFPEPETLLPDVASSISVGDVNGDGFPDLLFAGDPVHQISGSTFLNDGRGNFQLSGRTPPAGTTLADLNGDGKADLVAFVGDTLMIWPGTGDPNFNSSPITIQVPASVGSFGGFLVADLNGNGLPELIGNDGIAWNKGNFQFDFTPMTMNGVFAVGDVNNDGRLDLITANGTFLNQGNQQFTQIANNGLPLVSGDAAVLADFNGDGNLDAAFVMPFAEQFVTVAYGKGDGTFYVQGLMSSTEAGLGNDNIAGIVAGNFEGKGLADIVTPLEDSASVLVLSPDGKGQFQTSFFASGAVPVIIVTGDFNLDGKPDIAILGRGVSPSTAVIVFGH
jgi:hypothetical protein